MMMIEKVAKPTHQQAVARERKWRPLVLLQS